MQAQTFYTFSTGIKENRLIFDTEINFDSKVADAEKEAGTFIVWRKEIMEILREKTAGEVVIFLIKRIVKNHSTEIEEELNGESELMEILPPCSFGELATTALLTELEIHYGIDISDREWEAVTTVREVGNFIEWKLREKLSRDPLKNFRFHEFPISPVFQP
ncbi:MAG: hypothetical protein ABIE14_05490 [Patescibacteria group bacterium]